MSMRRFRAWLRATFLPVPAWFVALVAVAILAAMASAALIVSGEARGWTGEEEPLPQLRGLFHLVSDMTRLQPHVDPNLPVRYADVNPYGINTFLEQEVEPAKREQAMRMIADAGFKWIRQEFPWQDIEIQGKGDYRDCRQGTCISAWAKYDNIVALAEKYHIQIIARLSTPPSWSRAQGDAAGTFAPPDNYNDYGDFVAAVVSRYRGRIRFYQIWNEPNIYPEWGEQEVNPEAYTRLLRVAYTRAKAADPDCVILAGALAATIENDPVRHGSSQPAMNDFIFLQRMYDAGAAPYFDILSIQGYGLWSGPLDRRMRPRVLDFSRPLYIRDIMVKNGDSAKPIWVSEMNWNAIPTSLAAYPAYGRVSLAQQAEYDVLAYQRAQAEWPWMGVINYWFFKRATDAEAAQPMYYFRLVDPDFTPMPAYAALKQLTHSTPVLGLGMHQASHWAIQYEGGWRTQPATGSLYGTVMSSASGDLRFAWRGTGLAVRLAGPATVAVQLDGGTPVQCTPGPGFAELRLASRLPDRQHAVALRVLSGTVDIDAFRVWRDPGPASFVPPAIIACGATLFALSLWLRQRRRIANSSKRVPAVTSK